MADSPQIVRSMRDHNLDKDSDIDQPTFKLLSTVFA